MLSGLRTDVPNENQRRVVADGDRLYVTLGYRAPMSILDGATGKVITTIQATQGTREILVSEGIAVAYTQGMEEGPKAGALVAVDGRSGEVLWQKPVGQTRGEGGASSKRGKKAGDTAAGPIRPLSWAIEGGRIVYMSGQRLAALRLKTGADLWAVPAGKIVPRTLVAVDDVIVLQDARTVAAYDATKGELLWDKTVPAIAGAEGEDLFVANGLVWRDSVRGRQRPACGQERQRPGHWLGPSHRRRRNASSFRTCGARSIIIAAIATRRPPTIWSVPTKGPSSSISRGTTTVRTTGFAAPAGMA